MLVVFWTTEDRASGEGPRDHYEVVETRQQAAFRYDQLINTKAFLMAAGIAPISEATEPHWTDEEETIR